MVIHRASKDPSKGVVAPRQATYGELVNLNFMCVGVQKAGTTWLDNLLRNHPAVWSPCVKELHYYDEIYVPFTRPWSAQHRIRNAANVIRWQQESPRPDPRVIAEAEFIGREVVDDDWYRELFEMCPKGCIKGEVTPEYCMVTDEGVLRILSDSPRAQFFLMLREPVSRDTSHIRMILANEGFAPNCSMQEYAERLPTYMQWLDYEKRGDYLPILERWMRLVPRNQFHVMFFEEISRNPKRLVDEVCRKLHIDPKPVRNLATEVVHKGEQYSLPDWVIEELTLRHRAAIAEIRRMFDLGDLW